MNTRLVAPIVLGLVLSPWGMFAQSKDTRTLVNRFDALQEAVRALEKQVGDLSALLRQTLNPSLVADIPPIEMNIGGSSTKGTENATVALIEFSDFECPFCGRHAQTVYRELQRRFVETGKIKYNFRHLPLEQIHPLARKAAEAAECAGDQGKFWEMHDRLFANQKGLQAANLLAHGQTIGLNQSQFEQCLTQGHMSARVSEDLVEARLRGLTATPTFLLGEIGENGVVKVTKRISGAHSLAVFQQALDSLLQPK